MSNATDTETYWELYYNLQMTPWAQLQPVLQLVDNPGGRDENGKLITMGVKAGDRVLFGKYAGNEIRVEGVEHLILREDEILGVVEK